MENNENVKKEEINLEGIDFISKTSDNNFEHEDTKFVGSEAEWQDHERSTGKTVVIAENTEKESLDNGN